MSTTTAPPAALTASKKRHPAREKALAPYLDKLRNWITQVGNSDPESSARINVGSQTVILEGWDRVQLVEFFAAESSEASESAELMAHAVALVLKANFDVECLKNGNPDDSPKLYALQAELMLDTALGMALLDETQQAIDHWVLSGRVVDAKAMSVFRHQISRAVAQAKKRIADSELHQAEVLSKSLGDRLPEARPVPEVRRPTSAPAEVEPILLDGEGDLVEIDQPVRRKKPRKGVPVKRAGSLPGPTDTVVYPSFTKILSVGLVGVVGLFVLVVLVPMLFDRELPGMLRSDLPNADLLESVEAMPPSIYATVSDDRWREFGDRERRTMIDELGRQAAGLGYSGVILRTPDGRPVARWLQERGYELVRQHEELPYQSVGY